ncbi:2-iminobutanoate/2-iminopropanoate deaminase [Methylobacterium dankookense]|uniref:2-iminobutanoate/2-iminopropanoate deaminase n=2 Tax=Methylobacterium dankookense TaxID=560405 RepID=A0A564G2L4_9HYPH|nr:Putative aminoacrylate peracid reductase RutC [Methylobacterium dankookense]VUF14352.1 2-iminobutanoate/2-iminopropanoate deaminase [Methylobacterium dankookense]
MSTMIDTAKGSAAVLQPAGWPTPRGYANGMAASGRVVVTGGVVGWDEAERFPEGFVAQVQQALRNIRAILAEGGAEPRHLVRLTWYVTDMDAYLEARRDLGGVYRDVFGQHFPAMALVQVVRLVEAQALVEIEATAVVPEAGAYQK